MIVFHSPVSTVLVSTYSFNLSAIAQVLAGLYGIHLPVEVQMLLNCRKAANKLLYMILSYYFITTGLNRIHKSQKRYETLFANTMDISGEEEKHIHNRK